MAITLETLSKHLDSRGYDHKMDEASNSIYTYFGTYVYRDHDGDHCLHIVIEVEEEGAIVVVRAPMLYRATNFAYHPVVALACLKITSHTRLIRYSLKEDVGEIYAQIDVAVEDGDLTVIQLECILKALVILTDAFDETMLGAIINGEIIFDSEKVNKWCQYSEESGVVTDVKNTCKKGDNGSEGVSCDNAENTQTSSKKKKLLH